MKKDQDQNSTDSTEIEALITRIERGQLRDEDAQLLARAAPYRRDQIRARGLALFCLSRALHSAVTR